MQCRARDRGPIVPVLSLLPFTALDSRFNCDGNLKRIRERYKGCIRTVVF